MIIVQKGQARLLVYGGLVINGNWEITIDKSNKQFTVVQRKKVIAYDYIIPTGQHKSKGDYHEILNDTQDRIDRGEFNDKEENSMTRRKTMGVKTTADELMDETKQHLMDAYDSTIKILNADTWGHTDYNIPEVLELTTKILKLIEEV